MHPRKLAATLLYWRCMFHLHHYSCGATPGFMFKIHRAGMLHDDFREQNIIHGTCRSFGIQVTSVRGCIGLLTTSL